MNTIDKMFEYNLWANTQLIALCGDLDADQLAVEVAGVFGRIHPTLTHLVRAEAAYIFHLTGDLAFEDNLDWDNMSFEMLLAQARISGQHLIQIVSQVDPAKEVVSGPYRFFNWTVVLQALYHGIEHRTQVKMLLTQLGVEHPEFAGWDYTVQLIS